MFCVVHYVVHHRCWFPVLTHCRVFHALQWFILLPLLCSTVPHIAGCFMLCSDSFCCHSFVALYHTLQVSLALHITGCSTNMAFHPGCQYLGSTHYLKKPHIIQGASYAVQYRVSHILQVFHPGCQCLRRTLPQWPPHGLPPCWHSPETTKAVRGT